jgi:phytoene dehydrogenase-like protein
MERVTHEPSTPQPDPRPDARGASETEPEHRATDVVVVGGGVAGLVAALECARLGLGVTLLEQAERPGGCVGRIDLDGLALDSGAESFATRNGSVAELAERLGLATGALYHYFPGKEQLLIRICDQLMSPLLAASEEVLAAASAPEKQLRELVRLWVAHVTRHRDHLLVFQQVRHLVDHGEQWKQIRADRKRFERLLAGALERALGPGSPAERDLALYALLGMVNHTVQWFRPRGSLSAEQVADGYVDLVLGGPGA